MFWAVAPRDQGKSTQELSSLEANPNHPSLQFKRVHTREPIYAVRVGIGWRVLGLRKDNAIYWFWIGPHGEYEKLLNQL